MARHRQRLQETRSPGDGAQSGDVRGRSGRARSPPSSSCATSFTAAASPGLRLPDQSLALVHRAVRQFRRSGGGRTRQGPGRNSAPHPQRHRSPRCWPTRRQDLFQQAGAALEKGDLVLVEAGDIIPSDGEVVEGVAIGGRKRHHRRKRAGDPGIRRRPFGGDRRHARAVRLYRGQDHRDPGLDLPGPHDRAGGRRRAPEDPQRDRAQHPAGGPDHHLRLRRGDHPGLCRLCRRRHLGAGAGGAVRHPDPHHHRRAAVGHRHRRHGPAGALQCAGHVGPRGGSGGRRGYAAAGQDRHHHPRQPPGRPSSCRWTASASRNWPKPLSLPRSPTKRRKAARSSRWRRTNMASKDGQARRTTFVPFTAQTRLQGIDLAGCSIRKGAVDAVLAWAGAVAAGCRRALDAPSPTASPRPAARRWRWPRTAAAGRHPSQGHRQGRHPRALHASCARWASAR